MGSPAFSFEMAKPAAVAVKDNPLKSIFSTCASEPPTTPPPTADETDGGKNLFKLPVNPAQQRLLAKPHKVKAVPTNKPSTSLPTVEVPVFGVSKAELALLESPWRKVAFSVDNRKALVDSITSYKPSCDSVSEARVLLLGPVGAGKSSFISSVHSVFSGRVTNRAMVGTSSACFTRKLRSYSIRTNGGRGNRPVALALCDAMGLCMGEKTGTSLYDVLTVIKGHAPEGHKFRPDQPLSTETVGYVKKPSASERMHCVAFVVDATKIDSYGKGMGSTFQQLREHISDVGVHQVALLTHVDQLCPATASDITKVYRSRIVKLAMEKAAALLGMPMSYIVPVKNYSSELEVDEHTDTLLLSAVQHILQYVELHFQDQTDLRVV